MVDQEYDGELKNSMPSPEEFVQIQETLGMCRDAQFLTKKLQEDDLTVADVRFLFDNYMNYHPDAAEYLAPAAEVSYNSN